MSKKTQEKDPDGRAPSMSKKGYEGQLHRLQIELVKLQRHFIKCDDRILIILEGRDAAGKDGTIKRIVQHLSPRETRASSSYLPTTHQIPIAAGWRSSRQCRNNH